MAFFFRRSINFGLLRINLSQSGIGASVGVKGARGTMNARGTTYVTLGSNGFYYRETISNPGRRTQTGPIPQQQVEPGQPDNQIRTADVAELVDSSSAELVNRLNERASKVNLALLPYAMAAFAFAAGIALTISSSTPAKMPPLPGIDRPLQDLQAEGKDEYSILLARYGQPNAVSITKVQTLQIWTATYDLAHLAIQLVPVGCTASFESYISNENLSASISNSRVNSTRQRRKRSPDKILDCSPMPPFRSAIVRYSDAAGVEMMGNEAAQQRLDSMTLHLNAQPIISRQVSDGLPGSSALNKSQQSLASLTVPFDEETYNNERQRIGDLEKTRRRDEVYGIISFFAGALLSIVAILLHRRYNRNRMTRLVYELSEAGQQHQQILETSTASLASSQAIWRVVTNSHTSDWKHNAGASHLLTRSRASMTASVPPYVESNIPLQCLNLGAIRLYFLPDLVLYWQNGSFGSISYDDLIVEYGPTRFIEDGYVPGDARQVGTTWKYVRKDGGPDLRFNNNTRFPVMQYGTLVLASSHGLQLLLHVSNLESAQAFSDTMKTFCGKDGENLPPPSEKRQPRSSAKPKSSSSSAAEALKVLGLDPSASSAQIIEAYRKLALMYHPDKVAGLGPELQEVADRKMKEINAAYEALRSR